MTVSIENWAEQVRAGDVRAISRAVSAIENREREAEEILRQLFPYTGRAYRVGITGAPGKWSCRWSSASETFLMAVAERPLSNSVKRSIQNQRMAL